MIILDTFSTDDGLLTIQFEFTYPDQAGGKLSQVLAFFYDQAELAISPPPSPPSPPPSPVNIALTGVTTFSGQTALNANGSCYLATSASGNGWVFFNHIYYTSGSNEYTFEGTATGFAWTNPG
jgi:hypothetical protein